MELDLGSKNYLKDCPNKYHSNDWRFLIKREMEGLSIDHSPNSTSKNTILENLVPKIAKFTFECMESCEEKYKEIFYENLFFSGGNTQYKGKKILAGKKLMELMVPGFLERFDYEMKILKNDFKMQVQSEDRVQGVIRGGLKYAEDGHLCDLQNVENLHLPKQRVQKNFNPNFLFTSD